jgi:WD40 repeat protein
MSIISQILLFAFILEFAHGVPKAVIDVPAKKILSILYSPDGKLIVVGTMRHDPNVQPLMLFDVATGKLRCELGAKIANSYVFGLATFSHDSKTIIGTKVDQPIRLWDVATAEVRDTLDPGKEGAGSAVVTPDGKTLIVSAGKGPNLQFWDLENKKLVDEIEDAGSISKLIISTDGKRLAAGEGMGRLTVYDLPKRKAIFRWEPGTVDSRQFAFSPDGKMIVPTLRGRGMMPGIWDVDSRKRIDSIEFPRIPRIDKKQYGTTDRDLAFSPDGTILAFSGGFFILLYDVQNHEFYTRIYTGDDQVLRIAFSPDGKTLAASCQHFERQTATIKIWNVPSPHKPREK